MAMRLARMAIGNGQASADRFKQQCASRVPRRRRQPDSTDADGRLSQAQRRGDQRTDVFKRAGAGRAEERFQFREREFDRIEVGAVG